LFGRTQRFCLDHGRGPPVSSCGCADGQFVPTESAGKPCDVQPAGRFVELSGILELGPASPLAPKPLHTVLGGVNFDKNVPPGRESVLAPPVKF